MPCLNESDLAVSTVERAENTIDTVARIAKKMEHAPLMQALRNEIADGLGHGNYSLADELTRAKPPLIVAVPIVRLGAINQAFPVSAPSSSRPHCLKSPVAPVGLQLILLTPG